MVELRLSGLRYHTHEKVYDPHDDTELLIEAVDVRPGDRAIDLGCGAGLVGIHMAKRGARVLCADLNRYALRLARENARLNDAHVECVRMDLLKAVPLERFDVIAFNPPYLPTTAEERVSQPLDRAFDGGDDGMAVANLFLDAFAARPARRAFILGSSLQGNGGVTAAAQARGLRFRVACTKRLSWETLSVYDLSSEEAGEPDEHDPR